MATQPVPGLDITRYQGDLSNPDVATAQTVEVMCDQIAKASNDPLVRRAARDAVNRFGGGPLYVIAGVDPWKNQCAQAESVWWWAKHGLKFQHHDGMIAVYFNERDQLQLLISPDLLLRMGQPRGDCAIYTMLICAMLRCLGIDAEIVTAAVDPSIPDVFSHVYPRAVLPGRRLVLDASHGEYPGWEVPPEHILRKQVWDLGGNPISDQAPRFKGLHSYHRRGMGQVTAPTPISGVGGMNPTFLLLLAGIAAGLWFLPGWSKLLVPGGVVGLMVARNWSLCTSSATETHLINAVTGAMIPNSSNYGTMMVGCPQGIQCKTVSTAGSPNWNCLLNPFPGGL